MRSVWLALALFSTPVMAWENQDKYLMTSYIVMQAIDIKQTDKALRQGGIELNPMYGSSHSVAELVGYKAIGTGLVYWLADVNESSRTEVLIGANIVQFLAVRHNYFYVQFGF